MISFDLFICVNSALCAVIGIPLNILLIWLALKKTPIDLRSNIVAVLHSCAFNIILLICTFYLEPTFLIVDGIPMLMKKSFFATFSHPIDTIIAKIWLFLMLFLATSGLCVQFYYRYLVLIRKTENFMFVYFGLLLFAAFFQTIFTGFFVFGPRDEASVTDAQIFRENVSVENLQIIIPQHSKTTYFENHEWIILGVIYNIFILLTIVFCVIKIANLTKKIPTNAKQQYEHRFNRQINLGIFVQAALLIFFYSLTLLIVGFASSTHSPFLLASTILLGPALNWLPTVLPLITICSTVRYRKALVRLPRTKCVNVLPTMQLLNNNKYSQFVNRPLPSIGGCVVAALSERRRFSDQTSPIFTVENKLNSRKNRPQSVADGRQRIEQLPRMNHSRVFSKQLGTNLVTRRLASPLKLAPKRVVPVGISVTRNY
uniref:Gustatory receptor n=1 Tax=Globodera rostochiensis TaxID=31243 RepID=A0A914I3P9_GLORO